MATSFVAEPLLTGPSAPYVIVAMQECARMNDLLDEVRRSLLELLEKSYKDGCSTEEAVRLAVKALLEVVEAGAKSIEIGIMRRDAPLAMMAEADVAAVAAALEAEKAAEAAEAAGDAAATAAAREGRALPPAAPAPA